MKEYKIDYRNSIFNIFSFWTRKTERNTTPPILSNNVEMAQKFGPRSLQVD